MSSANPKQKSSPTRKPAALKELAVVILAAGKGTRMKSRKAKVLHEIAGLPMISHLVTTAESLKPKKIIVVLSPGQEDVAAAVAPHAVAIQKLQRGTGDAMKAAIDQLGDFKGQVIVLFGDVPLISKETLEMLVEHHRKGKDFGATVLAFAAQDPKGYGRIFQNGDGTLARIVEEADATEDEKIVRLCNSGTMIMEGDGLEDALGRIKNKNAQGEFYLVDLPKILAEDGLSTGVIRGDFHELKGVNSRAQLAEVEMIWQHRKRVAIMENGVTLQDPNTVYFSHDTQIGQDSIVGANVVFGKGVEIEDNVEVKAFSHLEGAIVKSGAVIGPFARLRPGSDIGNDARIGNFVEIKNSKIGTGAKANHLGYIGDAELGNHSNFGCGAITVNYDGLKKSKTIIGKNVMVGSNSSLVAPITIADGAYIAAGSTLTKDVAADDLVIARAKPLVMAGKAKGRMKQKD